MRDTLENLDPVIAGSAATVLCLLDKPMSRW